LDSVDSLPRIFRVIEREVVYVSVSVSVSVQVNAGDMKRAIDLFMCSDYWPSGVLVKRFFKPKPNDGQSS